MVFDAIRELLREQSTGDTKFLKDMLYYFELRVPAHKVIGGPPIFLVPLILGPEAYSLSEPFAISETETQGAGLFVEENGIIRRTIRLQGHTGFKPRLPKVAGHVASIKIPETGRSFFRDIRDPIEAISGHGHFKYLQDAVFRTYGDLKRDPSSSEGTKLFFHILREDEHWEVKPRNFTLTRELESRNLYYYDIELLVVGPANDPGLNFSEDKSILDTIRDSIRMVQSAIDLARSAITDITGVVKEIERTVKGIGATLNSAVSIINAAEDLVNGVADVIAAPFESVATVVNNLSSALEQMHASAVSFPDPVRNSLRQVQDAFDRLGSFPQLFQTDTQRSLEAARRGQELSSSKSQATLREAAAKAPPNSFQTMLALGTANLPGDLQRARSELQISKALDHYESAEERVLNSSDTLHSLAAKYLGDARLYQHIAVLNNLRYPFISREGIPGTKRPGDRILIPSRARAPESKPITPVLGVPPNASAEERVLGTDLKMERVPGPGDLFDWVIDIEGGSVDLKKVAGVPNLEQGLLARLRTERGTDQLYRNLGVDRVIGLISPVLSASVIAIRVGQAVRADPRIAGVRRLEISQPSSDAVEIDFDAEVIGISGSNQVNLSF